MINNKLKINDSNTEFIVFRSPQAKQDLSGLSVIVGDSIIQQSSKVRNLGIIFDQFLSFDDYISSVCRSTHFHLRNIGRIRHLLSQNATAQLIRSCNIIVKTCMNNAVYNSNTCIGYKLSFFRNTFCLDMKCKLTRAITLIRNVHLNVNEQAIVDTLIALIDVRAGHLVIDHFNNDDIVNMINELSIA